MPLVIHPRVRKGLRRIAAMTAFGVFASTGVAMACPSQSVTQPFSSLGDTNSYFLLTGGNFEGPSLNGWHLWNAQTVAGNEPFNVGSSSDSQSLLINGGGSAFSPVTCFNSTMPNIRFFARQAAGGGDLKVTLYLVGGGQTSQGFSVDNVADLPDGSMPSWAPTGNLSLSSALALAPGQDAYGVLRFQSAGSGAWNIDDVYVDPYSFG